MKKGKSISSQTPLAQFAKRAELSYHQIAKLTRLSESNLKKVASGIRPLSCKVAIRLSSRFGLGIDFLLSKEVNGKVLNTDGEEWHSFDPAPPGTASGYDSNDLKLVNIKAVEACAEEAGYSLPSEKDMRYRIAKAIFWCNPQCTPAELKKLKPHMVEPARHVLNLYEKWKMRNKIVIKSAEIPLPGYIQNKVTELTQSARRTARQDIMRQLEALLVDASYHPESPLIAVGIMKSLLKIRVEFRVANRGKLSS